MKLHGFTLIRNAIQYDYPFEESLRSLAGVCRRVIVAVGQSDDGTEAAVGRISSVETISTVWDENLRKGGIILSQQTNIALDSLREKMRQSGEIEDAWGFYLQADEVISEKDYPRLLADIRLAHEQGYDAVRFRYLHFWQSYRQVAVAKRWYPHEIRAVRLNSKAESYGDAQSFRGVEKIFESDAHIYHYGHVREKGSYEKKKRDFHRWWHSDQEMEGVLARGEKRDRSEETISYLGAHPSVMSERMKKSGEPPPVERDKIYLIGDASRFSPEFLAGIRARNLVWAKRVGLLSFFKKEDLVILKGSLWDRLRFRSSVPFSMRSPQARPWSEEFRTVLLLSEKGVSFSGSVLEAGRSFL